MRNKKSEESIILVFDKQKGIHRMDILTQLLIKFQRDLSNDSRLYQEIIKLTSTVYQNPGVNNYVTLTQEIDKEFRKKALTLLQETLETADKVYRYSEQRRQFYYVKQTRSRRIITVFGDLTYRRTEYVDRETKEPFCYVDWKFDIGKWERYDSCVQALIVDSYADSNSMIKVGKIIGDKINGSFNVPFDKNTAIPRQTVRKIILRHQDLKAEITRAEHTPETLYIMADEKFIPLQREKKKDSQEMVKMAVAFENIKAVKRKDGTDTRRKQIINKTTVANSNIDFWDTVIDVLHKKYDMEKVKNIYLLGDGANWIKAGVDLLRYPAKNVKFGIDSFHFNRAIRKISPDKTTYKILSSYASHDHKEDFKKLADSIMENYPDRKEMIQQNLSYIMNQWTYYQVTITEIAVGCPMEQEISHVLASVFTSVAKAYGRSHFPTYLNNRIILQNNYDVRSTLLKKKSDTITNSQEFDFSVFEKKQYLPNPTISEFNKNIITKF